MGVLDKMPAKSGSTTGILSKMPAKGSTVTRPTAYKDLTKFIQNQVLQVKAQPAKIKESARIQRKQAQEKQIIDSSRPLSQAIKSGIEGFKAGAERAETLNKDLTKAYKSGDMNVLEYLTQNVGLGLNKLIMPATGAIMGVTDPAVSTIVKGMEKITSPLVNYSRKTATKSGDLQKIQAQIDKPLNEIKKKYDSLPEATKIRMRNAGGVLESIGTLLGAYGAGTSLGNASLGKMLSAKPVPPPDKRLPYLFPERAAKPKYPSVLEKPSRKIEKAYSKVEEELFNIENNYAKLRKTQRYSKDANAKVRRMTVESDVLPGSIDETGTIRTKQAGGAWDQYREGTIGNADNVVRRNLERLKESVDLNTVEKKLTQVVIDSGIEGKALRQALNDIKKEIAGYRLRADANGKVPLTVIHDAKVAANKIDWTSPIETRKYKTALERGLKEVVEEGSSFNVKEVNQALAPHLQVLKYLESLDGKKVKGGKLGKYFAQITGNIVGGVVGHAVGGPLGAAGGTIIGGEIASKLKGKSMASMFGEKTGIPIPKSEILQKAGEQASMPQLMLPAPKPNAPRSWKGSGKTIELPSKSASTIEAQERSSRQIAQSNATTMTNTTSMPSIMPEVPKKVKLPSVNKANQQIPSISWIKKNANEIKLNQAKKAFIMEQGDVTIFPTNQLIVEADGFVKGAIEKPIKTLKDFDKYNQNDSFFIVKSEKLPFNSAGEPGTKAVETPKTVSVWKKSKFSNEGHYEDVPVLRKEENITLYQGGKAGDNRQFWTPDKKYAEQFGEVKEKTGTFYKIDNGNRVTDVYVEAPFKMGSLEAVSQKAFERTIRSGGTTIDLNSMKIKEGIAFSPSKTSEVKIPLKDFSKESVTNYLKKKYPTFKKGDKLGTWINPENKNVYLDISRVLPESKAISALKSAKKADQIAVYSIGKKNFQLLDERSLSEIAKAIKSDQSYKPRNTGKYLNEIGDVNKVDFTTTKTNQFTTKQEKIWKALPESKKQQYLRFKRKTAEVYEEFKDNAIKLGKDLGVKLSDVEFMRKSDGRTIQKMFPKGGATETVFDANRGGIISSDFSRYPEFIQEISDKIFNGNVFRIKNLIKSPTPDGYRAISINGYLQNGTLAEFQIIPEGISKVKSKAHSLYEVTRVIPDENLTTTQYKMFTDSWNNIDKSKYSEYKSIVDNI